MVDTSFTGFAFTAKDASLARKMPDRYNDIINVKDWGAVGDGVTDDQAAIQAAIEYAMHLGITTANGATVFMPPGTYFVAKPILLAIAAFDDNSVSLGGGQGLFQLVGAGRDATIITGNWGTHQKIGGFPEGTRDFYPYILQRDVRNSSYLSLGRIKGLTVINTSTISGSGALFLHNVLSTAVLINCRFKGMAAVSLGDTFGMSIRHCVFECNLPINTADNAIPGVQTRAGLTTSGFSQPATKVRFTVPSTAAFTSGNSYPITSAVFSIGPIYGSTYAFTVIDSVTLQVQGNWVLGGFGGLTVNGITSSAYSTVDQRLYVTVPSTAQCTNNMFTKMGVMGIGTNFSWTFPAGTYALNIIDGTTLETVSTFTPSGSSSNFKINPGHSVGCFTNQTIVENCIATGFDIAYCIGGPGSALLGCSAYRCNVGVVFGIILGYGIGQEGAAAANAYGCSFDRCKWGAWMLSAANGPLFGGNAITGTDGVATAAVIQSITFSGGNAQVQTTNPHNLPTSGGPFKLLIATVPASLTPDGTGRQILSCTRTGASTFTYTQGGASGTFSSATWNYPLEYAITVNQAVSSLFAGNDISAQVALVSVDMNAQQGTGFVAALGYCYCMSGNYGWAPSQNGIGDSASMNYQMCGIAGNGPPAAPVSFLHLSDLPGQEGAEFSINNADLQASFGGIVTATGGTNHYKVRYNGTNWVRVG